MTVQVMHPTAFTKFFIRNSNINLVCYTCTAAFNDHCGGPVLLKYLIFLGSIACPVKVEGKGRAVSHCTTYGSHFVSMGPKFTRSKPGNLNT